MPKILLVEDNEMNRDMLSRRLQRKGFEVEMAVDGKQGVDMALANQYDLILMDMSLPEIDGWEATRRVREGHGDKRVPIIALTAHAMQGDRQRCLDADMDGYVAKPIKPVELFEVIDRVIAANAANAGAFA